ncbi:MAG: diguanylate cyclase [Pseudomonadota bacterium]
MGVSVSPVFLSGAFAGITALILLLSLLIGQAYRERMLWWHAATLGVALVAQLCGAVGADEVGALFHALQVLLAVQTLRFTLGSDGPVRGAWKASRWLMLSLGLVLLLQLAWAHSYLWMLLPWAVVTCWYLARCWDQGQPWISWMAVGQLAWAMQWLVWTYAHVAGDGNAPYTDVASLAMLALAGSAIYLAMVWRSRIQSENSLRVQAREKVDPLTGFVMPRIFFTQVNDAQVRSLSLGYSTVLLLVRLHNLEQIMKEREAETSEPIVLAAAQAIASALRPHDIGARVSGNRFGVLAEGVSTREGAVDLATRILAHGLRGADFGLPGSEMKFHIAGIEISRLGLDVGLILKGLEDALAGIGPATGGRPIRILTELEIPLSIDGTLPT